MKTSAIVRITVLFAALVLASPARGSLITLIFSGMIDESNGHAGISVGDTFDYHITFDLNTPDADPGPAVGNYAAGVQNIALYINDSPYYSDLPSTVFTVSKNFDESGTDVWSSRTFGSILVFLDLYDTTQSAHASDALIIPELANYTSRELYLSDSDDFSARGTIDSLTVVPEPATTTLLLLGAVGLLYGRRRTA